ncbi:MAG TPA: FHA domain-containing protein [Pseudomonadota bacterium]|nr:FHA domain-containing protein [Pseudomonadota bacterium]
MTLGLVCDACDTLSPLSATLCSTCGAALGSKTVPGPSPAPRSCPNCGSEIPGQHRFCGFCGARSDGADLRPVWLAGPSTKTRLVLVGTDGQDSLSFPLTDGEHVAGRLEGAVMFPEDRLLSPRHATFVLQAGKLWVRDDGSHNGVYIRLRAPKIVPSGTLLLIGEQLIRVESALPDVLPYPDHEGTYFYCSPHRTARLTLVQFLTGGDVGLIYRSRGDTVTIGRELNDVNFPEDPYISGRHAQIVALEDGHFQITDLGSKNGTFEKVPKIVQLFSGDQLLLGQQLLRIELG